MNSLTPSPWPAPRERGRPPAFVLNVLPYTLLAFLTVVTAVVKKPGQSLTIDLALCGAVALWIFWIYTLHPGWRERPAAMGVFLAGLVGLMAVLVIRAPWFGFLAPVGYVFSFRLLPWPWRLAGVGAVAVVAGTAQASQLDKGTAFGAFAYSAILVANVVPLCGFAWSDWNATLVNEERRRAVELVSAANQRLEATMAENVGLQAQLLTQAREAGVLDERQRMAREIHDTIAQGLTGIITQLQAAEQAVSGDRGAMASAGPGDRDGLDGLDGLGAPSALSAQAEWNKHFEAAKRLARESLTEARRSVDALRPEPLETARLSEALAKVAERWSELNGVPVQVATTGDVRWMPPESEVALLRVGQEALANVAKHARDATRVGLTLSYLDRDVVLDIRDDGPGFDAGDGTVLGGVGLLAMRQRVEGLSGILHIESEPGFGTAISASIPAPFVQKAST